MYKKLQKKFMVLMLFSLLLFATTSAINGQIIQTNDIKQVNKINSMASQYNVTSGQDLIYNITTLWYNGTHTMPVNDTYGNPAGELEQGNTMAFSFQNYGNNGTYDYVEGSIRSSTIYSDLSMQYYLLNPANVTTVNMGPPLIYFAIPIDTDFPTLGSNFTNAGFSVNNNGATFSVRISYYSSQSAFSKVGSSNNGYNTFLNVTWDINTGIMLHYYYNYTSGLGSILELQYLGSFNPNVMMPYFEYQDVSLFYDISTLQVETANRLNLTNPDDPSSYGYLEQGQSALIQLHTQMNQNGPYYDGQLSSLTGSSYVGDPYQNNGNNNGNNNGGSPPDLFFIFPVASNQDWWSSVSLEFSLMGLQTNGETAGSITFSQSDPNNANNHVELTINKTTGVLIHYKLNMADASVLNMGFNGTFNFEFNLLASYNMQTLYPYYGISAGKQFRYHLDTLNFNGNTETEAELGTFQQGQDFDILFDQFSLVNGPNALITMSTKTGQAHTNVTYDIFGNQDGPLFFFPILPINSSTQDLHFFGAMFHFILGATINDTASTIGFSIQNLQIPEMTINHLIINWNKTTGLMINYDLDVSNPTNSSEYMHVKLHLIGESTGQHLYTTSSPTNTTATTSSRTTLTTTPGFGFIVFTSGFVCLVVIYKRKKLHK